MSYATVTLPIIEPPVIVTLKDINDDNQSGVMVAFRIPLNIADEISIVDGAMIGAEVIPSEDMHLTLAYLGDSQELIQEQQLIDAVEAFAKTHFHLEGQVNGYGQFAHATDGKQPFYANFDSPDLPEFRQDLVTVLNLAGIAVAKNHGFTPHITLAYIPEDYPSKLPDVQGVGITFDKLYLSIGSDNMEFELMENPISVTLK